MSECQEYEYSSNADNYTVDIVKRGQYWYTASTLTKDELEAIENNPAFDFSNMRARLWASRFDHDKVRKNGKQTLYTKINISIGHAEKYCDPSF